MMIIDALQSSKWTREIFESWVAANIAAVHVTVAYWHNCRQTLAAISRWQNRFAAHSDVIVPVRSIEDIDNAAKSGKTGIILGFQNSSPIENNLALVEIFWQMNVRIMQLTYNNQTLTGGGCYEAHDGGLTLFGKNVIREMNRLEMIIDLSHTGERTSLQAIEHSQRPVAVTHANPLSFEPAVRNKSDKLLRALAQAGGMLGFSLYPGHLRDGSNCTIEAFCEMVARTAEMIGINHVGLGSDLCLGWDDHDLDFMLNGDWNRRSQGDAHTWAEYPQWFRDNRDFPNIAAGLQRAGFGTQEISKILYGNWYRFLAESMPAKQPLNGAA